MNVRCLFCKGRLHCGRPYCPIAAKISHLKKRNSSLKEEYEGEAPNIFVGRYGYPNVNVGVLSVEQYKDHDAPKKWSKHWYSINQVIGLREELINSGKKLSISSPAGRSHFKRLRDVIETISPRESNNNSNNDLDEDLISSNNNFPSGSRITGSVRLNNNNSKGTSINNSLHNLSSNSIHNSINNSSSYSDSNYSNRGYSNRNYSNRNYSNSDSKFTQELKEIAMARKPAEVEVKLDSLPRPRLSFNQYIAPTNLNAGLSRLNIIANTKINRAVEKVAEQDDMKANDAVDYLMKKRYDQYSIQRLLAGGVLGSKSQRRFVPTRWSITATDDIMGKKLKAKISEYKRADYRVYFGGHMGNYYLIMLFPAPFAYELYEMAIEGNVNSGNKNMGRSRGNREGDKTGMPDREISEGGMPEGGMPEGGMSERGTLDRGMSDRGGSSRGSDSWDADADASRRLAVPRHMRDYEGFRGRRDYAEDTAGGYYAARLSVLQKLDEIKRTASVLALRFVTKEYWAPLGVWVVREAVKKALEGRGIGFETRDLMLEYSGSLAARKFGVDVKRLLSDSFILNDVLKQKTLDSFS